MGAKKGWAEKGRVEKGWPKKILSQRGLELIATTARTLTRKDRRRAISILAGLEVAADVLKKR